MQVSAKAVSDALLIAGQFTYKNSPKPILQRVLFEGGAVRATDYNVSVRLSGVVPPELTAVAPPSELRQILSGVVYADFSVQDNALVVDTGNGRFQLTTADPEEFPPFEFPKGPSFETVPHLLSSAMSKAAVFTDKAIDYIHLECDGDVCLVIATDGRRLHLERVDKDGEAFEANIPVEAARKVAGVLAKADEESSCVVSSAKGKVGFSCDGVEIVAAEAARRFPAWKDLVQKRSEEKKSVVSSTRLLSACRQVLAITQDESRMGQFSFRENVISVKGRDAEVGRGEVKVPIDSGEVDSLLYLNIAYLVQFLQVLPKETQVSVFIVDNKIPVRFEWSGGVHLIMPMAPPDVPF